MTDLYERRLEAVESASKTLDAYFAGFTPSQVVELADYLLHGKQTSGEETQTLGSVTVLNKTSGDVIDLDALSIRILENLDLIGDASWHEEEDEPQPGDADFGEIRAYTREELEALPIGTRVEYFGPGPYWEKREGGWFSEWDNGTLLDLEEEDGRVILNPEILGTFRPVEG